MKPPKAIIAQTGRSGSGYIAKVLQAYGITCGHEKYFCFPWRTPQAVEGDSSWLAVKHLEDYEGIVFHQIRNPLHVLTSLMHTYPNQQRNAEKYFPFREEMMPYRTGDLQRDFMAMIVWMNEEVEKHKDYGWPIEDFNVDIFSGLFHYLPYEFDRARAKQAIQSVSKSYNSHHDSDYLSWDDIPDSEEKEQLMKQAEKYGYDTE